ncbi:SRPBCC family protein [Streptomyces sp. NPDC060064]|uniref:SRPBCC family protein n=1 Tax=Streptomyces sp. NPDC060064 TaxID=3347049 RepID=UPI0036C7B3FE
MELQNSFTVPVPLDAAWRVLLDIERVAPCMPGATVDSVDGETVNGAAVKVRVGPITVTYRGTATFQEKDESAHRIVLAAQGKEVRGQGTARATTTGTLADRDGGTAVNVVTDLTITGRPAQFGRGVPVRASAPVSGRSRSVYAYSWSGCTWYWGSTVWKVSLTPLTPLTAWFRCSVLPFGFFRRANG